MNEERLLDALAAIEESRLPGYAGTLRHDQAEWAGRRGECGTVACLAGWVTHLAGYEPVWAAEESGWGTTLLCASPEGAVKWSIPVLAKELLELENWEWRELFFECGNLDDLYVATARYLGVEETVLRDKVQDRVRGAGL